MSRPPAPHGRPYETVLTEAESRRATLAWLQGRIAEALAGGATALDLAHLTVECCALVAVEMRDECAGCCPYDGEEYGVQDCAIAWHRIPLEAP